MILDFAIFVCLASCFLLTVSFVRRSATVPVTAAPELKALPSIIREPAPETGRSPKRLDHWLQMTLIQAAVPLSATTVLLASICVAFLAGILANMTSLPLAAQMAIVAFVFLLIPVTLLMLRNRRIKKFSDQFPATIELISRAVGAGESFEGATQVAAGAAQQPVKRELQWCVKQFEMGMPVSSVMKELTTRVPTLDTRIFAHTVSVHREMGGRLSKTLGQLSRVITDRNEYVQRLRSLTGLARFSIFAISFIGVFVLGYLAIMHPEYVNKLLGSELGKKMVLYGIVSEVVGIIWISLTLKLEY